MDYAIKSERKRNNWCWNCETEQRSEGRNLPGPNVVFLLKYTIYLLWERKRTFYWILSWFDVFLNIPHDSPPSWSEICLFLNMLISQIWEISQAPEASFIFLSSRHSVPVEGTSFIFLSSRHSVPVEGTFYRDWMARW